MSRILLITGANRGIGLGLTELFLGRGYQVVATAREISKADQLRALQTRYAKELRLENVDVASDDSVAALADRLTDLSRIDVLVNNAGVYLERDASFSDLSLDQIRNTFEVNTLGAMRMNRAFLKSLQKSEKPVIANITSRMGSIEDNTSGGYYGYRMSKAALNMFNKSFAVDFPAITSVVLHPGWVQTDMGGKQAPLKIDEATQGLVKVIEGLTVEDSGRFLSHRGEHLPW